jgi:hypothetical protein
MWGPQTPGTLRACPGLYRDCFASFCYLSTNLNWTPIYDQFYQFRTSQYFYKNSLTFLLCISSGVPQSSVFFLDLSLLSYMPDTLVFDVTILTRQVEQQ